MYSEEIKRLLEIKNNLVSLQEYYEIVNSPQIDHILYSNDEFIIWTNDNYNFKLKIRKEKKL